MVLIKVLKDWIRNNGPTDYPKISIYSISSKLVMSISSTGEAWKKCLFMLAIFLLNLKYLFRLMDISFDSVSKVNYFLIIQAFCANCSHILLHFKYNQNFLRQIEDIWSDLQIDYDYETRKYFWTRKVIYYLLFTNGTIFLCIYDIGDMYRTWPYSDANQATNKSIYMYNENQIHYWTLVMRFPILYIYIFVEAFILLDLLVLAQTALKCIDIKLNKIHKASNIDEKMLNINVIHNLRLKYSSTHRLVNKMNEFVSPCLLIHCIITLDHFVYILYFGLFVQQSLVTRLYRTFGYIGMVMNLFLIIHAAVDVYAKSQEVLITVYKLSLKTDYLKVINEISLFLNYDGIGFSLGGIIMMTTSSISTLFSFLTTIIIAIPSFDRDNIASNKNGK